MVVFRYHKAQWSCSNNVYNFCVWMAAIWRQMNDHIDTKINDSTILVNLRPIPDNQHYHNIYSVSPCTCLLQPLEGNPALQQDCECWEPLVEWTVQPLDYWEEKEVDHGRMALDQQQGSCKEFFIVYNCFISITILLHEPAFDHELIDDPWTAWGWWKSLTRVHQFNHLWHVWEISIF